MADVAAMNEALRRVAMADLDRGRQEELPLDSREKRGYTFQPRRDGTHNIPRRVKAELQKGWGNPIRDEESEQMEGLVVPEMPYREGRARQIITVDDASLSSAAFNGVSKKKKKAKQHLQTQEPSRTAPVPVKVLTDNTAPITGVVTEQLAVQSPEIRVQLPSKGDSAIRYEEFTKSLSQCAIVCNWPEKEEDFASKWCFYHGCCLMYPTADTHNFFKAGFEACLVKSPSNEMDLGGWLRFSAPGLPDRTHDLNTLNKPLLDGRFCILSTQGVIASASYRIELKDAEATEQFQKSIMGLQIALARHAEQRNAAAPEPPKTPSNEQRAQQDTAHGKGKTGGLSIGVSSTPRATVCLPELCRSQSQTGTLIDLDDDSQIAHSFKAHETTEAALLLLDQMATSLLATSANFPPSFIPIEQAMDQALAERYPSMTRQDRSRATGNFQDILGMIVNLKKQCRDAKCQVNCNSFSGELKEFLKKIRFEPEDILRHRCRGVLPKGTQASVDTFHGLGGPYKDVWKLKDSRSKQAVTPSKNLGAVLPLTPRVKCASSANTIPVSQTDRTCHVRAKESPDPSVWFTPETHIESPAEASRPAEARPITEPAPATSADGRARRPGLESSIYATGGTTTPRTRQPGLEASMYANSSVPTSQTRQLNPETPPFTPMPATSHQLNAQASQYTPIPVISSVTRRKGLRDSMYAN